MERIERGDMGYDLHVERFREWDCSIHCRGQYFFSRAIWHSHYRRQPFPRDSKRRAVCVRDFTHDFDVHLHRWQRHRHSHGNRWLLMDIFQRQLMAHCYQRREWDWQWHTHLQCRFHHGTCHAYRSSYHRRENSDRDANWRALYGFDHAQRRIYPGHWHRRRH